MKSLTHAQAFRLYEWVRVTAATGDLDGLSFEHVAEKAEKAMDFPVSASSISSARNVTGATWEPARKSPTRAVKRDEIEELKRRIEALERALAGPPPGVHRLNLSRTGD